MDRTAQGLARQPKTRPKTSTSDYDLKTFSHDQGSKVTSGSSRGDPTRRPASTSVSQGYSTKESRGVTASTGDTFGDILSKAGFNHFDKPDSSGSASKHSRAASDITPSSTSRSSRAVQEGSSTTPRTRHRNTSGSDSSGKGKSKHEQKDKRRARSASRPRDTPSSSSRDTKSVSRQSSRDSQPMGSFDERDVEESPNQRREDRSQPRGGDRSSASQRDSSDYDERRSLGKGVKSAGKDRKTRSASAPREIRTRDNDVIEDRKQKSHSRHLSTDLDNLSPQSKTMHRQNHSASRNQQQQQQQHRKTEAGRHIEADDSLEGIPYPATSSKSKSSSFPMKLVHTITRPTTLSPTDSQSSHQRQPTPSRPRRKMSKGGTERDLLEEDFEILDKKNFKKEHTTSFSNDPAEESLMSTSLVSDSKLMLRTQKEGQASSSSQSIQRPSSIPYMQTFPRTTKTNVPYRPQQQQYYHENSSSPTSTLSPSESRPGGRQKRDGVYTTERSRQNLTHQLSTPDSVFSSIHKVPSQSSFTSSDARSEVCLDLPDIPDHQHEEVPLEEQHRTKERHVKLGFPSAPYRPIVHITRSNLCLAIFVNTLIFIVSFILIWPLVVVVLLIVPVVLIVKRVFSMCCCCGSRLWGRCCVCVCHTHLTSSEVLWLGKKSTAGNPVSLALLVLQKGLDTERIKHLIESRILSVENRNGHRLYPRFTQKVVEFCCGQAWVSDHHFHVSTHVISMPGYIETLEDLQMFISKMAAEPLPLDKPLWEVQVLHNFREPRDTVLLFRMHLCMTDGVSMTHILENALVDTQQKVATAKSAFSSEATNTSPFKVLFSGPMTFISRYLCGGRDFNLLHGGHVRPSGETVVAWSEPFSLNAAMRVKQVARCTLMELLLSITAGTLRTYLQVNGIQHPFNMNCVLPVDFQSLDGGAMDMENKYSMVVLPLPTNTEGAIPRLWETKHLMEKFKGSAEAAIVNGARWLTCCLLPMTCFQRLWRKIYSRCTLLIANLAGPSSVLKFDSREIKCMMFWAPPLERVTLTVSFLTYADQLRMAVMADRAVIPNPDLLTRDFNYKLETLSKLLAHRRIPGESASVRQENLHSLSSYTVDDLTTEQIQLEMSLVQQELHDLKLQLESGPTNRLSAADTQLMQRIESLKERSRELLLHLRKRRAEESESAVILVDDGPEDDLESESGDRHQRPFRRRTLSMSSRLSTASVSSTARPLSTASTSNLPSPVHTALPSWPEGDAALEEMEEANLSDKMLIFNRIAGHPVTDINSPVREYHRSKGRYHSVIS